MFQWMLAIWSLVPLPFLNPAWTSASSWFTYYWSLAWRILSINLLACEMSQIVRQFEHSLARLVMVERSDKKWSIGGGNGKPLQYSYLKNPMKSRKGKKIGHWKMNSPGQKVPNMLLEISGEITPERMKGWSQSKNTTQSWMWLVMEARSDALKSNIA